jgi:hypothetical protein
MCKCVKIYETIFSPKTCEVSKMGKKYRSFYQVQSGLQSRDGQSRETFYKLHSPRKLSPTRTPQHN